MAKTKSLSAIHYYDKEGKAITLYERARLERCTYCENNSHAYQVLGRQGVNKGRVGILNKKSKKINQYTLSGDFVKTRDCMRDVQRTLNIRVGTLWSACNGKYKTAGGYIWKYFIY